MKLYVYSDESGVFDKQHYRWFVFGGIIILDTDNKELWSRKYSAAEKGINEGNKYGNQELKASRISAKDKNKLFRSLNHCYKFSAVIDMSKLLDEIFESKKDKQRYLDYVYKTVIEEALYNLSDEGLLDLNSVDKIIFNLDEHSTATNGLYEIKQLLEQEFQLGTFNYDYSRYYSPILPNCTEVSVEFCDSANKLLIRASDIVANKIYWCAVNDRLDGLDQAYNLFKLDFPIEK